MSWAHAFLIANFSTTPFWLLMIVLPRARVTRRLVHSALAPALLGVAYCLLIWTSHVEGGSVMSLAGVMAIFDNPQATIGGWVHYLIFDLFVGAWCLRDSQRRGIRHAWMVPCLILTLVFGPAGLLLYLIVRAVVGGPERLTLVEERVIEGEPKSAEPAAR